MNMEDYRDQMPILEEKRYLNWGMNGPSPRSVVEEVEETLENQEYGDIAFEAVDPPTTRLLEEARDSVSEFLNCPSSEVAFTQNTSEGINIALGAVDWEEGDRVLVTDHEHRLC